MLIRQRALPMTFAMPQSQSKVDHDWLLAHKPDDVVHDPTGCTHCSLGGASEEQEGGALTVADITQADIDAAVANAVADATAPLLSRLAEHEGAAAAAAAQAKIDEAVAAAVAPLQEQIVDLTAKFDDTTVQLNAEKARADGLEQLIADATKAAEEAAEMETRRVAREADAKQFGGFTAEQLSEADPEGVSRLDRFVAMSDDMWSGRVDVWKEAKPADESKPPKSTSLVASADDGTTPTSHSSAARQLAGARLSKVGPISSLTRGR